MLENGLLDVLIQKIVDEVVRRIKNQPKKAVVFFTGATIGFKDSMDSLLKLQKDGWQLKVVLSDDGMKVLDPVAIQWQHKKPKRAIWIGRYVCDRYHEREYGC